MTVLLHGSRTRGGRLSTRATSAVEFARVQHSTRANPLSSMHGRAPRPMNLHDIAKEVLEVLGTGRQLDPFSKVYPDFGLKDAYNVTATVRAGREARGERCIGRKIGFTNRTIWAE